jgi:signal transduction histidine kinase
VLADAAVAAALCLGHDRLVPDAVLTDGSSWVFVVASATVIAGQLGPYPLLGAAAAGTIIAGYVGGLLLASAGLGFAPVLGVQAALVGSLLALLRRACRAADVVIEERAAVERAAAVHAARRAQEREHLRLLHDSVSATLTVVAGGVVATGSVALREQARRDLAVIEGIRAPTLDPAPSSAGTDLARWLGPVLTAAEPAVTVDAVIRPGAVPDRVGAAFAGAVAEALANVARHAGVSRAWLRAGPARGRIAVDVADAGAGFDPAAVPAHRHGLRESVAGRMQAVGGSAAVTSALGAGTRIALRWPADPADRGGADG